MITAREPAALETMEQLMEWISWQILIQTVHSKQTKQIRVENLCSCRCWKPETFYTSTMEFYVGLQPEGPFQISNGPHDIALRIGEPIFGCGRNIIGLQD